MASITSETNGRKCVQFVAADGRRKSVRLGKATMKFAEKVQSNVQRLLAANTLGESPEAEVVQWLAGLDDKPYSRLASAGLVKPRTSHRSTLAAFIDGYTASRPDVKSRTLSNMKQVRQWLVKCFGERRDLRTIGASEAEDFRTFMLKGGLGENTVRRHIGRCRQLFKVAIRRGLVHGVNPFDGMSATVRCDKSRQFFVTRDMTARVLDACPDAEWRLLVALGRYGALRCPSEHLALKWADVDWDRSRIRVWSPKTEHHQGKESRLIPLFPELRPLLLEVFEQAEPGTEHIITRYRDGTANLRTQFHRIIRKAGLEPWPKPWHNLRSSRQTELVAEHPEHVVCAWLGNSRAVAREHYLQVRDFDFDRAAGVEKAVQNPVQLGAEMARNGSHLEVVNVQNPPEIQRFAVPCEVVQQGGYPRQDSNL